MSGSGDSTTQNSQRECVGTHDQFFSLTLPPDYHLDVFTKSEWHNIAFGLTTLTNLILEGTILQCLRLSNTLRAGMGDILTASKLNGRPPASNLMNLPIQAAAR